MAVVASRTEQPRLFWREHIDRQNLAALLVRAEVHAGARRALDGDTLLAIDVNEIVRGVLQSLGGELKDGGIENRPDLAELPLIDGHRGQLQEVIFNLVQNAIEAMATMEDRSRILRVRTEPRGRDAVAVAVEDSGPGIAPSQLEDIFAAFVTTKPHGMGLGLAICRMIIEHHGGALTASSDGQNGATFQFVLPIKSVDNATR